MVYRVFYQPKQDPSPHDTSWLGDIEADSSLNVLTYVIGKYGKPKEGYHYYTMIVSKIEKPL